MQSTSILFFTVQTKCIYKLEADSLASLDDRSDHVLPMTPWDTNFRRDTTINNRNGLPLEKTCLIATLKFNVARKFLYKVDVLQPWVSVHFGESFSLFHGVHLVSERRLVLADFGKEIQKSNFCFRFLHCFFTNYLHFLQIIYYTDE